MNIGIHTYKNHNQNWVSNHTQKLSNANSKYIWYKCFDWSLFLSTFQMFFFYNNLQYRFDCFYTRLYYAWKYCSTHFQVNLFNFLQVQLYLLFKTDYLNFFFFFARKDRKKYEKYIFQITQWQGEFTENIVYILIQTVYTETECHL